MKRKKWSELEEQTLLSKYSDLLNSGTLAKLKTREKKFKPIADHVNSVHHLQDPSTFPFRWSWRDVSIKVQNMRHQYLGVKQKIRVPDGDFNWKDGENHWENFLKYKEVFGDVELEIKNNNNNNSNNKRLFGEESVDLFGSNSGGFGDDVLGLGFEIDSEDLEEDGDLGDDLGGSESEFRGETEELAEGGEGFIGGKRLKKSGDGDWGSSKRLGLVGAQMLELREVMLRREERRREREWSREESLLERQDYKKILQKKRDGGVGMRELELEDRQIMWARREAERRLRLEREFDEERRRRMQMEERWEEEEMGWKERTLGLQIEHEKQMMQMHAHACQNQMQILGVMARLVCQFFGAGNDGLGSGNDGLGGGLGALPPQDLQSLQHPGGLGDNGKPDSNSPPEFI